MCQQTECAGRATTSMMNRPLRVRITHGTETNALSQDSDKPYMGGMIYSRIHFKAGRFSPRVAGWFEFFELSSSSSIARLKQQVLSTFSTSTSGRTTHARKGSLVGWLVVDFPLLVPAPFPSSAPLHGTIDLPFPLRKKPL